MELIRAACDMERRRRLGIKTSSATMDPLYQHHGNQSNNHLPPHSNHLSSSHPSLSNLHAADTKHTSHHNSHPNHIMHGKKPMIITVIFQCVQNSYHTDK